MTGRNWKDTNSIAPGTPEMIAVEPMMWLEWQMGWWVVVRGHDGSLFARRGYNTAEEAEAAKVDLRRRLAEAPGGDGFAVLQEWEVRG